MFKRGVPPVTAVSLISMVLKNNGPSDSSVEACYDNILARMMVGVKHKLEVIQLRKANIPKNWLQLLYLLDVHHVPTNLELPGGSWGHALIPCGLEPETAVRIPQTWARSLWVDQRNAGPVGGW